MAINVIYSAVVVSILTAFMSVSTESEVNELLRKWFHTFSNIFPSIPCHVQCLSSRQLSAWSIFSFPHSRSLQHSVNFLFSVLSSNLAISGFWMNLACIPGSQRSSALSFHCVISKFGMLLASALHSLGVSHFSICSAVAWSLNRIAFWCCINCSELLNSWSPIINLQGWKLLKGWSSPKNL